MSGFKARRISFIIDENLNQTIHTTLKSEAYHSTNLISCNKVQKIGCIVGIFSLIFYSLTLNTSNKSKTLMTLRSVNPFKIA